MNCYTYQLCDMEQVVEHLGAPFPSENGRGDTHSVLQRCYKENT